MDLELKQISKRAWQGDFDEAERLYGIAESSLQAGDKEKALWCYKELAFAYRLQALRTRSELERLVECSKEPPKPTRPISDFLFQWIEKFPQGFVSLPLNDDALKDMAILNQKLSIAADALPEIWHLAGEEIEMMELPMHNFRSVPRYLACFIYVYFGEMIDPRYLYWLNQNVKLRIFIDLLAAHILDESKARG